MTARPAYSQHLVITHVRTRVATSTCVGRAYVCVRTCVRAYVRVPLPTCDVPMFFMLYNMFHMFHMFHNMFHMFY